MNKGTCGVYPNKMLKKNFLSSLKIFSKRSKIPSELIKILSRNWIPNYVLLEKLNIGKVKVLTVNIKL